MRISPLLAFDECARGVESESPAGLVEGRGVALTLNPKLAAYMYKFVLLQDLGLRIPLLELGQATTCVTG